LKYICQHIWDRKSPLILYFDAEWKSRLGVEPFPSDDYDGEVDGDDDGLDGEDAPKSASLSRRWTSATATAAVASGNITRPDGGHSFGLARGALGSLGMSTADVVSAVGSGGGGAGGGGGGGGWGGGEKRGGRSSSSGTALSMTSAALAAEPRPGRGRKQTASSVSEFKLMGYMDDIFEGPESDDEPKKKKTKKRR